MFPLVALSGYQWVRFVSEQMGIHTGYIPEDRLIYQATS